MKMISKISVFIIFCSFFSNAIAYGQTNFVNEKFDPQVWQNMTISEQEIAKDQVRFEILQERKTELQETLDLMMSYKAPKAALSSNNMLGIPLRVGKLQVSAMFKKARGAIVKCEKNYFEGIFDAYKLVVKPDPNTPGRVVGLITGGNNPNVPTEPVAAKINTNGKTAKITLGSDWLSITYKGNEKYSIKTNRVPVTIKAKYID